MAAWRFTICCHPKSRWPPSEHMHQSPEIRDWRNTAEVSIRGITNPEAGNRQVTRKKERGEPSVTLPSTQPRSQGTLLQELRTARNVPLSCRWVSYKCSARTHCSHLLSQSPFLFCFFPFHPSQYLTLMFFHTCRARHRTWLCCSMYLSNN